MNGTHPATCPQPHERMAAAIVSITREKGGCLPQDLNEIGFTPDEVVLWWGQSKPLATRLLAKH